MRDLREPVLIVHGVANHEPEPFRVAVAALQRKIGTGFRLISRVLGRLRRSFDRYSGLLAANKDGNWTVRAADEEGVFPRQSVATLAQAN